MFGKSMLFWLGVVLWSGLGMALAACSSFSPQAVATLPASNPTAAPATSVGAAVTAAPVAAGQLRLVLAPDGNEARYRVREQLANVSFPSDAVGATNAVSGTLVLAADGTVVRDQSKFVVDLQTLRSDRQQRDNYIQRSTLETSRFPTAEFVPTEARGLPSPLPTSGEVTFQLVGDMTVHGVTRSTTWDVKAQVQGQELVGNAATTFKFADFGMTVPRTFAVLSVEDSIRLELNFHLVLASAGS